MTSNPVFIRTRCKSEVHGIRELAGPQSPDSRESPHELRELGDQVSQVSLKRAGRVSWVSG